MWYRTKSVLFHSMGMGELKWPLPLLRKIYTRRSPKLTISHRPMFLVSAMKRTCLSVRHPPEKAKEMRAILGGSVKVLLLLLVEIQTPSSPSPSISIAFLPMVSASRRTCRWMLHTPAFRPKHFTTGTGWKLMVLRVMTTPFMPKPTIYATPDAAVGSECQNDVQ